MIGFGLLLFMMNSSIRPAPRGKPCPPTAQEFRAARTFYKIVAAESGILLFHGGELFAVFPFSPTPEKADYLGLLPVTPGRGCVRCFHDARGA